MQHNLLESSKLVQCKEEHNLSKIIFLDLKKDVKFEERALCEVCATKGRGEMCQLQKAIEKYFIEKEKYCKEREQKIQQIDKNLLPVKACLYVIREKLNSRIQKILDDINQVKNIVINDYTRYKFDPNTQSSLTVLREIAQELSIENRKDISVTKYCTNILPNFKEFSKDFNEFITSAKEALKTLLCDRINYNVIQTSEQKLLCNAAAFNKDGTLLALAQNTQIQFWEQKTIKVGETTKKEFKKTKLLTVHNMPIQCLCFGSLSNILVSGSLNGKLDIQGEKNENKNKPLIQFQLENAIHSIIILQQDREILASSGNQIFICQYEGDEWKAKNKLERHTNFVYQLSKNEAENIFASCSYDKTILVWKKNHENEKQEKPLTSVEKNFFEQLWVVTAQIKTKNYVYNLCIINDSLIAFQEDGCGYLQFYEKPVGQETYKLQNDIKVQLHFLKTTWKDFQFEMIFDPISNIIFLRHNQKEVLIVRRRKSGKFYIEQQFTGEDKIIGAMSPDAQQIVLWNKDPAQILFYQRQMAPELTKEQIKEMKRKVDQYEKQKNNQQSQQQLWNIEYQLTTQRQSQNSSKESEQKQLIMKCSSCKAEIHDNPLEQQKNKVEESKNNSQSENHSQRQRIKIVEQDPEPFYFDQFTKWEKNGQKILFKQKFELDNKQQQCSTEKSIFNGNKKQESQTQNKMPYIYRQGNNMNIVFQDQNKKNQYDIKHQENNDRDEEQLVHFDDDDPKN